MSNLDEVNEMFIDVDGVGICSILSNLFLTHWFKTDTILTVEYDLSIIGQL